MNKTEIINAYHDLCKQNHWKIDATQEQALKVLNQTIQPPPSWVNRLLNGWSKKSAPYGVYLYGDVGRGKTMVMDLFYEHIALNKKRRWHFSEFMALIHKELKKAAKQSRTDQPINHVIDNLIKEADLICLDEFQVTEIADAMLLSRLFSGLCQSGVQVILTSNIHPKNLYQGGLHYERFYPFIELLQAKFTIFHLNNEANRDYRRLAYHPQKCYFNKNSPQAYAESENLLTQLTGTNVFHSSILHVNQREIILPRTAKKTVWISFKDLCGTALGPSDYLVLSENYNLLFLIDVPELTEDLKNEARRFISLIDTWYDQNHLLVMIMETDLDHLFTLYDPAIPFKRTLSRLKEMQTIKYWGEEA